MKGLYKLDPAVFLSWISLASKESRSRMDLQMLGFEGLEGASPDVQSIAKRGHRFRLEIGRREPSDFLELVAEEGPTGDRDVEAVGSQGEGHRQSEVGGGGVPA